MHARIDDRLLTLCGDQRVNPRQRHDGLAGVGDALDAGAGQDRTPVIAEADRSVAGVDLFLDVVEVADDGVVGVERGRTRDLGAHGLQVEVAEGVAHPDVARERRAQRDRREGGRDPRRGELGGAVQDHLAFVGFLGAGVILAAEGDAGVGPHQGQFAGQVEAGGVGLGLVDRVQRRELGQVALEVVDVGDARAAAVGRGRAGSRRYRVVELDVLAADIGEVVEDRRTQVTGRRALIAGLADRRAVITRTGEVQTPVQIPLAKRMFAAQGVGEDRLLERTQCGALVDVDAVDRSEQRGVADAAVGIAGVGHDARGHDRAGRGGRARRNRGIRLAIVGVEDVVVAGFVVREGREDRLEEDAVPIGRAPVQPARIGVVLAGQAIELVLGLARPQAVPAAAGLNVLGHDFPVDLIVVGDHVAFEIAARGEQADLADAGVEPIRHDQLPFVRVAVAELGAARAQLAGDAQARIVEGRAGDDVDVARDGLAGQVGGHRLVDDDLRSDGGREGVIAGVAALGADDADAVDRQGGPVVRRTAQRDIAGLALIAFDGGAGHASDSLGDVLVRQTADGVGGDDADEAVGVALDLKGGGFGFGDRPAAGDDDFVNLIGGLNLGEGGVADEQGRDSSPQQKCEFHFEHPRWSDRPPGRRL